MGNHNGSRDLLKVCLVNEEWKWQIIGEGNSLSWNKYKLIIFNRCTSIDWVYPEIDFWTFKIDESLEDHSSQLMTNSKQQDFGVQILNLENYLAICSWRVTSIWKNKMRIHQLVRELLLRSKMESWVRLNNDEGTIPSKLQLLKNSSRLQMANGIGNVSWESNIREIQEP